MNSVYDSKILAEKLSKLNNTQQSIETLSHWCIFHRKKAKLVVETWEKQFNSSEKEQKISFLYLANDILQNSRRKGSEFVGEFWKVLPAALKAVLENGDRGKNVVTRLVDIWEERKVFGSRTQSLKEDMLGSEPPPPLETSRRASRSVRVVKRDPHSIKVKLAIGGFPEKIVSAFQSVNSDHANEDMALNKCKIAINHVTRIEKEMEITFPLGEQQKASFVNELQEQEVVLKQCIDKLETVKATREALVSQLKETLQDQESKLERVRTQLQVAHAHSDQAGGIRQRLSNGSTIQQGSTLASNDQPDSNDAKKDTKKTVAELAAAVAAKLSASTSSAQMLTSVLSSFAAEEAKSAGLKTSSSGQPAGSFPSLSPAKRPKLDEPMIHSEGNTMAATFLASSQLVMPTVQQHPMSVQHPGSNIQGQVLVQQPTYTLLQPPQLQPPPQQYLQAQNSGVMVLPYNYPSSTMTPQQPPLPPPPPLPPHTVLSRPAPLTHQPSFQPLQPPSMSFYGQTNQPTGALGPR